MPPLGPSACVIRLLCTVFSKSQCWQTGNDILNPVLSDLKGYTFIQNILQAYPMDLQHMLPTCEYLDFTQGPVSVK